MTDNATTVIVAAALKLRQERFVIDGEAAELTVPEKSGRLCGVPFELEERFVITA